MEHICCLCKKREGIKQIKKNLNLWVCKECHKDLKKTWEDILDKEMNGGKE